VLAQQHDRLREVRIEQLRHRQQERWCERHDRSLPDCKVRAQEKCFVQGAWCQVRRRVLGTRRARNLV
jgi:hypothetical protein